MTHFNRIVIAATSFLILSTMINLSDASAQNARRSRYSAQQRSEIRAMPILSRPSRPLHFYGNTVRRNAGPSSSEPSGSSTQVAAKPTVDPVDRTPARKKADATTVRKAKSQPAKQASAASVEMTDTSDETENAGVQQKQGTIEQPTLKSIFIRAGFVAPSTQE